MRTALVAVLAALGLIPCAARADIPAPRPPATDRKFVVEVDENAKAPRLIIPQHQVAPRFKEKAAPAPPGRPGLPGKEPLGFAGPGDEDDAPAPAPRDPNHLIVAGVAVTLALSLGGVWLVRRRGRPAAGGLVLLAALGGVLAVATVVWANAAAPKAPPAPRPHAGPPLPVAFDGQVKLEVVPAGDTIRLVLDKETYERLKKEPKAPGEK